MRLRLLSLLPAVLVVLAITGADAPAGPEPGGGLRMNQLQAIGTHNSYHRETSEREQAAYDALISTPGDYDAFLKYSQARLPQQLELQDLRGLELFPDPQGGLYATPLVRQRLGLGRTPRSGRSSARPS